MPLNPDVRVWPARTSASIAAELRMRRVRVRHLAVPSPLDVGIEQMQEPAVRHIRDLHEDRRAQVFEFFDPRGSRARLPRPGRRKVDDGLAVGTGDDADLHRQFVGDRRNNCGIPTHDLGRLIPGEQHHTGGHRRDGMQPHLHRRDNAEVAAAAPKCPEEIGFAMRVDGDIGLASTSFAPIRLSRARPATPLSGP